MTQIVNIEKMKKLTKDANRMKKPLRTIANISRQQYKGWQGDLLKSANEIYNAVNIIASDYVQCVTDIEEYNKISEICKHVRLVRSRLEVMKAYIYPMNQNAGWHLDLFDEMTNLRIYGINPIVENYKDQITD